MPSSAKPPSLTRLLHLEDSVTDAELFWPHLKREWPACEILRVETRETFVAALQEQKLDLILSDFTMPRFDGLEALTLARAKRPDIPFIFLSGTIGEAKAIAAFHHGATDYVLKDRPARLVPAIQRALREAAEQRSRRAAEASLRETEERFRQLTEASSDVFWFVDIDPHRIRYVSPAVEQVWGRKAEEFYSNPTIWAASLHPDDQARVLQNHAGWLAGSRKHFVEEYRVVRPDGLIRWVFDTGFLIRDASGQPQRTSGIARDITQAREVAEATLRAQRLESIGLLAGGVAHDLNNALAPVLMGVQLLRRKIPPGTEYLLSQIENGATRGGAMVRQLLGFARGAEGQRAIIDVRRLLSEIENFATSTFPKSIKIVVKHDPDMRKIDGDRTLLYQVLLNLAVNARDAMPAGGTLSLEAENVEVDGTYAGFIPEANPGTFVMLKVTDTGTGIPPELMGKIFDPFITTKPPGMGTGLGLTTVAGITHNLGGFVRVYSEQGKGSCFRIYFPAAPSGSIPPFPPAERPKADYRGNGALALVVDDEEPVRLLLKDLLESFDFRVLLAADGTEALAHFAANLQPVKLVLTDERMPHMDGITLVRTLRHMKPGLHIIAMSGLHEQNRIKEFASLQITHFLQKPFSIEQLTEALKGCLGPDLQQSELKLSP